MKTILKPCRVPWAISPSMSGLTLTYAETDVAPECNVVLGGGRMSESGRTDSRVIEIVFDGCTYTRASIHSDDAGIEALGYDILPEIDSRAADHPDWRAAQWMATGICPDSGFHVAIQSPWLESLPPRYREACHHYVVDGRDGYIELIARGFRWREWRWELGDRDDARAKGPVIGEGEGIE